MGHGEDHHEISREELFKPLEPSYIHRYVVPFIGALFDVPVTFFREQVVERFRKPYPYYHKRYHRVPTIDKCQLDDYACIIEANCQFQRDRLVDMYIVSILRKRQDDCSKWYKHNKEDVNRFCGEMINDHEEACVNYFIKYGELAWNTDVRDAYMKQKHRMLWERRYGPIGKGSGTDRSSLVKAGEKTVQEEDNMISKLRRSFSPKLLPKEMNP